MQKVIELDGRRLVIIVDPHIKVDEEYAVWKKGTELDLTWNDDKTFNSIFVKNTSIQAF